MKQQSLISQVSNYGGNTSSGGSGGQAKIETTAQKGPVLKRINIKKIPSSMKRTSESAGKSQQQILSTKKSLQH